MPPRERSDARHAATPPPLPETAFRGDETEDDDREGALPDSPPPAPPRYQVRRIGDPADPDERRFRGAPIDLDVKGADLHDVFRLIAEVGRVNIVVGSEVTGAITLRLKAVPWDQALDVVARARGLVVDRQGPVVVVRGGDAR